LYCTIPRTEALIIWEEVLGRERNRNGNEIKIRNFNAYEVLNEYRI
jgi:hypothetical protein